MNIEHIALDDSRVAIVENMLVGIEGVSPESFYNNKVREIPTAFYLGYEGQIPICVIETYSEELEELSLVNFGVDERSQRSGYGCQFLTVFENLAKEKGYSIIRLTSHPNSYGFYLKCGFAPDGEQKYGLIKAL